MTRAVRLVLCAVFVLAAVPRPASADPLVIKMGSLVPAGSPWDLMIQSMAEDWKKISNGQVTLRVYSGGVLGDEPDMLRKMRIGQIQALGVTSVGLSLIDQSVYALQVPLMFDSYAELDYVRDRMMPALNAAYEKKGAIILCWTDGGWIKFFCKKPVSSIDELRKLKLFVWQGDAKSLDLYTIAKFNPVPLAVTDMLPGLKTGLIDVLDTPPLAALINQWFGLAPYMLDVKFAPLIGAIVVDKRTWEKIPADQREPLRQAALKASAKVRSQIRRMGEDAVTAMTERGLKVIKVDAAGLATWHAEVDKLFPVLRVKLSDPAMIDEAMRLRNEYRAKARNG